MILLKNIKELLTLESAYKKDGRHLTKDDLSLLKDVSLIHDEKKILWIGKDIPSKYSNFSKTIDCSNLVITPELVDSHTHIVFGGDRSFEYSLRIDGADYEDIAKAGGGILNTMNATNNSSKEELFKLACERVERLHSYGVGTIEIKSGYGLNFDKEYELSHIINDVKKKYSPSIQIINTYMAAHAIPKKYSNGKEYIDDVVIPLMKKLNDEGIIDVVDIFHEDGYFSYDDTEYLFKEAQALGLSVKSHADEFKDNDGAALACQYKALSTDHLLRTSDKGIQALANSDTVACLLPGTGFFLGKPQADAKKFFNAGVKVAIGSDYNPGSCHWDNLLMIASISATTYGMNMAQLWSAITLNASHALGLKNQGAIVTGLAPRFSFFNCPSIDHITYHWGRNFSISQ
ncbi:MAG: imidazolonepropionase [Oligoflexia bacterium]|nr:imidazolonepropionase [Oligoflexia bacterium]